MLKNLVILLLSLFVSCALAAPVDINNASADNIAKALKGIGPSKAAAIVQFRIDNGPFKAIDELKYVKGVGQKIIDINRNDIIILSDNN